jgi:hypothetical protein
MGLSQKELIQKDSSSTLDSFVARGVFYDIVDKI